MSLIIDNFAGGGGASTGIEAALGRPIDFAVNHDPEAIAMHRANHPRTRHFCGSVWDVNPQGIAMGRRIDMGWFSPDCTFFSAARGGKPFRERNPARRRRGLAGLIPRWLTATGMDVFMMENVREFIDWGPLLADGRICPKRRGMLFRRWHAQIENIVSRQTRRRYRVDMRELVAADYDAPTTRKRLFVIGRADGAEIVFPAATNGTWAGAKPYRTAAECIDWSIPCPSIFERDKPLAEATMRRIARGVMRYVVNNPQPFIVQAAHGEWGYRDGARAWPLDRPLGPVTAGGVQHALVVPHITKFRTGATGSAMDEPMPTVTANSFVVRPGGAPPLGLVTAFLAKHNGGHENDGYLPTGPLHTITARDHHALVSAFLVRYNGASGPQSLAAPLTTIDTTDRFGLVMVHGEPHRIVDIGMRMLQPRELYRAQGFPDSYIIDRGIDDQGNELPLTKTAQIRMCGNSVAPPVAEALVRANIVEQREQVAA
jgi:DNA (cytosine-5)-methyltransferase 1